MIIFRQFFNLIFYTILALNGILLFTEYFFGISDMLTRIFQLIG